MEIEAEERELERVQQEKVLLVERRASAQIQAFEVIFNKRQSIP